MINANKARRLTRKARRNFAISFEDKYSFSLGKIDASIKYATGKGKYETQIYIYATVDKIDMDNLIEYYIKRGYVVTVDNRINWSSITLNWEPRYEDI